MLRTLMLVAVSILPLSSSMSQGDPQTNPGWATVRFLPLGDTIHRGYIQYIIWETSQSDESYDLMLELGDTWGCISTVVRILADVELGSHDAHPPPQLWEQGALTHSGRPWSFWYLLALVASADEQSAFAEPLDPELERLADEMHDAFLPFLEPVNPFPRPGGSPD